MTSIPLITTPPGDTVAADVPETAPRLAHLPVFSRRETRVRLRSHAQHYTRQLISAMKEVDDIIYFDAGLATDTEKQAVQARIQAYGQKVLQIMKDGQLWLHMYELTEPHRGGLVRTLRHEIRARRLCVNSIIRRTDGAYNLQRAVITDKAHAVAAMLSELSDANAVSTSRGWWGRFIDRSNQQRAADERSANFR